MWSFWHWKKQRIKLKIASPWLWSIVQKKEELKSHLFPIETQSTRLLVLSGKWIWRWVLYLHSLFSKYTYYVNFSAVSSSADSWTRNFYLFIFCYEFKEMNREWQTGRQASFREKRGFVEAWRNEKKHSEPNVWKVYQKRMERWKFTLLPHLSWMVVDGAKSQRVCSNKLFYNWSLISPFSTRIFLLFNFFTHWSWSLLRPVSIYSS